MENTYPHEYVAHRRLSGAIELFCKWCARSERQIDELRNSEHCHRRAEEAQKNSIQSTPTEFSDEQLESDGILRFFHYSHLPERLQSASKPFCDLARHMVDTLPRNPERTVALRKLLEAKDAAVRAGIN